MQFPSRRENSRIKSQISKDTGELRSDQPLPGAYLIRKRATGEIPVWGQQDSDDGTDDGDGHDEELESNEGLPEYNDTNGEALETIFVSTCARPRDEMLVIDGVKTTNSGLRRIYILLGFLFLASGIAIAAAKISRLMNSSSERNKGANQPQGIATPKYSPSSNLTLTIGEYLRRREDERQKGVLSIFSMTSGEIFIDIVNRTDTNFTFFGIHSHSEPLVEGVNVSLIAKMLAPLWNAHKLDVMEFLTVEGQTLPLEDMHDGMVLISMAGYPLTIQLDPFRVGSDIVSPIDYNIQFKNGVLHYLLQYPRPVVPWIGKSSLDVLVETNELYNGNLSAFIALVKAIPDLKQRLHLQQGNDNATTFFVPTNDALAPLNINLTSLEHGDKMSTWIRELILNHVVAGNFGRSCWWTIPTGDRVSKTELRLRSEAGQGLDLAINEVVMINGYVTITQEDIFSEQGIIHIIDTPLFL